jgi:hypothetical protein
MELTHDRTAPWFEPSDYRILELSPTGRFCIGAAWAKQGAGDPSVARAALELAPGPHRLAIGARGQLCGHGPAMSHLTVLPRATLGVVAGAVTRWSPVLTGGTSIELRVECPDIALAPLPRPTGDENWLRWQRPTDEGDLERWCAARLVSRETGEVDVPAWSWDLQNWAYASGIFPLGVDAYTIERLPPGAYTLEVRGPGIAPLTRELTLVAPEMETLVLAASRR